MLSVYPLLAASPVTTAMGKVRRFYEVELGTHPTKDANPWIDPAKVTLL